MGTFNKICPTQQLTDRLLHEVVSKWMDIRANAFVKTSVSIFKQKIHYLFN